MNHSPLQQYAAEHRLLLDVIAREGGIVEPVAVNLGEFQEPLTRKARKGKLIPVEGVLVRDWNPGSREYEGIDVGIRVHEIEGIRFCRVLFGYNMRQNNWAFVFTAVGRQDYARLYRIALRCHRDAEPPAQPPVLTAEQRDLLWR